MRRPVRETRGRSRIELRVVVGGPIVLLAEVVGTEVVVPDRRSRPATIASRPRPERVVHAPFGTKDLADLADRAPGPERVPHGRQQVRLAEGGGAHGGQRRRGLLRTALGAHPGRPGELTAFRLGIDLLKLDRLRLVLDEAVDADDHTLAALDLLLPLESRLLDLVLDEAALDRRDRASQLVHAADQLRRAGLELVRQRLDEV